MVKFSSLNFDKLILNWLLFPAVALRHILGGMAHVISETQLLRCIAFLLSRWKKSSYLASLRMPH